MLRKLVLLFILLCSSIWLFAEDKIITLENKKQIILHDDFTWEYINQESFNHDYSSILNNQIPEFLRQGIKVDRKTIIIAIEMYQQGWRYTMPRPKSAQARWGNYDGRTTWWFGYWENIKTNAFSQDMPVKSDNGIYYGNDRDLRFSWRRGGSPRYPNKIEWLLSDAGGVKPS